MTNIVPYSDQERMAQAIAKSGLFGLKDPVQVLALMAVAQAEGRHPASVARDYHVIQGRPALKADAMLARFQAAGGAVEWITYTDEKVEARFSHPQGGSLTLAWTLAQAKSIGLATKDNWKTYPRAMLRARVISEGIRTVYPGVLVGEYTPEEVGDFKEVNPRPQVIDIEPIEDDEEMEWQLPIFIPDGDGRKVYATARNTEEWVERYYKVIMSIHQSKMAPEVKAEKASAFRLVNKETYDLIHNAKGEKEDGKSDV